MARAAEEGEVATALAQFDQEGDQDSERLGGGVADGAQVHDHAGDAVGECFTQAAPQGVDLLADQERARDDEPRSAGLSNRYRHRGVLSQH